MTLKQIARAVLSAQRLGERTMDILSKNHPEVELHVYGDPALHVSQWNTMRVGRWVKETMLYPQYAERFKKEEVDGELLILLNAKVTRLPWPSLISSRWYVYTTRQSMP